MHRSSPFSMFMLLALGIATLWGFASVLGLRFRTGQDYPQYSTMRTDPHGAKAIYTALGRLTDITCERNYRPLIKLDGRRGNTLVLLNVYPDELKYGEALNANTLKKWAVQGGRVIITLKGEKGGAVDDIEDGRREAQEKRIEREIKERKAKRDKKEGEKNKEDKNPASKKKSEKEDSEEWKFKLQDSFAELFAVQVETIGSVKNDDPIKWDASVPVEPANCPQWHGRNFFKFLEPKGETNEEAHPLKGDSWQVLASRKDKPVLIEKRIGQGSIVLAGDSRFFSNEDLFNDPKPQFISWLIGNVSTVIFDETHLGVNEQPGIMTLARHYRMHGLFIGALVLFGLFIWRNGSSLIPANDQTGHKDNAVAGQSATAGMVSLLKRGIPKSQLLQRCLEVWERSLVNRSPALNSRIQNARDILVIETSKSRWKQQASKVYGQMAELIHARKQ